MWVVWGRWSIGGFELGRAGLGRSRGMGRGCGVGCGACWVGCLRGSVGTLYITGEVRDDMYLVQSCSGLVNFSIHCWVPHVLVDKSVLAQETNLSHMHIKM